MRSPAQNQSLAVKLLLSVVVVQLASRHLLPVLLELETSVVWKIADVFRAIGMAAALGLCATLTPWHMLRLKCFLAALCGYYISDIGLCVSWYAWRFPSPVSMALVQGSGFLVAAVYYWYRSYDQPSDTIEPGYLYCLRTKPASIQDFLISLIGIYGPDGGYAFYADGKLYRYRRGWVVAQQMDRLPVERYHVQRGARLTPAILDDLNKLVGKRWTWSRNCLTVLGPLWRRYRE